MSEDPAMLVTRTQLKSSAIDSLSRELEMSPEDVRYVIVFRGPKGYTLASREQEPKECVIQRMDLCQFIEHVKEEILRSHNEEGWSFLTFTGYMTDHVQADANALSAEQKRHCCTYIGPFKINC